jgi:hypothetical protein
VSKYFRQDYRFAGKRKTLAYVFIPSCPLKEARERRDEAHKLLQNDVDPGQYKKVTKTIQREQSEKTFQSLAVEWFVKNRHIWSEEHSRTIISRLENNVFLWIGSKPVPEFTSPELLSVLRRIENR